VIAKRNGSAGIDSDYIESVASALNIMALAADHLPLRLSVLLLEFGLLPANPSEATDYSQPDSVIVKPQRSRNTNSSARRVHAEMQVFDVLPDNLDGNAPYLDAVALSTHAASPQL
jgi:hypothetical protein